MSPPVPLTAVRPVLRRTARRPESRSSPSTDDGASAAAGSARTTSRDARGQARQAGADEVAQPAGDAVAHDRPADGAAHHETRTRRGVGGVRSGGRHQEVDDQSRAADASTPADGRGELVPAGEPGAGRQHRRGRVRPIAARGPCGGDRRGWRARPGCASAAGSRASRPAAVVRLEGALALAHGRLSRSTARIEAGRRSAECALDGTCWSAMVLDGARRAQPSADTVLTSVRSAVREGQTAPVQPIDPPLCHAEWRTPPAPSPHRILRHSGRLVSGGRCRLACPLTVRSGGILSPRPPPGPATPTSRASAYRLHTGVDRSGDG